MSNFQRAASLVAIGVCATAALSFFPADRASGATLIAPVGAAITPAEEVDPDPVLVIAPSIPRPSVDTVINAPRASLTALVQSHAAASADDSELECLATAVYFEAKGEPLAGQLAVARVIMNRAESGRFASTLCGVIKQPSQFSFVRRGSFPAVRNAVQWRSAVGVAQVAMKGLYQSPAPDALYFHAKRVSPNWGKRRIAAVGNHIFYR